MIEIVYRTFRDVREGTFIQKYIMHQHRHEKTVTVLSVTVLRSVAIYCNSPAVATQILYPDHILAIYLPVL